MRHFCLAVLIFIYSQSAHAGSDKEKIAEIITQISGVSKYCQSFYKIDIGITFKISDDETKIGRLKFGDSSFNSAIKDFENKRDLEVQRVGVQPWCNQQSSSLATAGIDGIMTTLLPQNINPPAKTEAAASDAATSSETEVDEDETNDLPGNQLTSSEKEFFEAAYFFLTGNETEDKNYIGRHYVMKNLPFINGVIDVDYEIERQCLVRQKVVGRVNRTNEISEANIVFDFEKSTGRYYTDRKQTFMSRPNYAYTMDAVGSKIMCGRNELMKPVIVEDGCKDRISVEYQDEIIRDRAVRAFTLIMSKYCQAAPQKPF